MIWGDGKWQVNVGPPTALPAARKELLHQEHSRQQRRPGASAAGDQVPSGPSTVRIDPSIKVNVVCRPGLRGSQVSPPTLSSSVRGLLTTDTASGGCKNKAEKTTCAK